jgi:hypothetical protein
MTEKADKPASGETAQAGARARGTHENPSFRTRFQPGMSGNPSGRPKGSRNKSKILENALNAKVTIREGGRSRSVSKFEVAVTRVINEAASGDAKALTSVLALIKTFNLIDKLPEPDIQKALTANDDRLIEDLMARINRSASSSSEDPTGEAGQ